MNNMRTLPIITVFLIFIFLSAGQVKGFSDEFSSDEINEVKRQENTTRTQSLVQKVEEYLRQNDVYVGVISRRGAGDPDTGVSDADDFDLTGMAHTGFIVKSGFSKDAEYITFNLVRLKGAKSVDNQEYDISELKVWSLPHFFIGSFEKDAVVFLPEKKVQLKLWNLLQANGSLDIEERKRYLKDTKGNQLLNSQGAPRYATDHIIKNGMFTLLHNMEYNLLSDYSERSTQNCNEHLLKTYIGARDFWQPGKEGYNLDKMAANAFNEFTKNVTESIDTHYTPANMVLSRTKSTFAFTQNIRFGERYKKSPTLLGLRLQEEQFDIVSVDSFCDVKNEQYLGWSDFKFFRENFTNEQGWFIEDWGKNFVKVNRMTGRKNVKKDS